MGWGGGGGKDNPDTQIGERGWLPSALDVPVLCFPE